MADAENVADSFQDMDPADREAADADIEKSTAEVNSEITEEQSQISKDVMDGIRKTKEAADLKTVNDLMHNNIPGDSILSNKQRAQMGDTFGHPDPDGGAGDGMFENPKYQDMLNWSPLDWSENGKDFMNDWKTKYESDCKNADPPIEPGEQIDTMNNLVSEIYKRIKGEAWPDYGFTDADEAEVKDAFKSKCRQFDNNFRRVGRKI